MLAKIRRPLTLILLTALCLGVAPALAADAKVNVNTATADQLELLPRVGPALAQRILDFREKNGPFKKTDELLLVRGIGEKTFALMEPYVTVAGETTLSAKVSSRRASTKD